MNPNINITPNNWQNELPKLKEMAAAELLGQEKAAVLSSGQIEKLRELQDGWTSAFCEIAIHAWRARRRMTDKHSGEVKEEHKATHRSVEGIIATLKGIGFDLRDREGEGYDFGLPEKVIASEKRPGISREIVAETIRPSIFYRDQLIKPGEIIIATPEDAATPTPPEETPPATNAAPKS
jgi:hypothetical protein